MRYIGLDFEPGVINVAQAEDKVASFYEKIVFNRDDFVGTLKSLFTLLNKYQPEVIVVCAPIYEDGSIGFFTKCSMELYNLLQQALWKYNIIICFQKYVIDGRGNLISDLKQTKEEHNIARVVQLLELFFQKKAQILD